MTTFKDFSLVCKILSGNEFLLQLHKIYKKSQPMIFVFLGLCLQVCGLSFHIQNHVFCHVSVTCYSNSYYTLCLCSVSQIKSMVLDHSVVQHACMALVTADKIKNEKKRLKLPKVVCHYSCLPNL